MAAVTSSMAAIASRESHFSALIIIMIYLVEMKGCVRVAC